MGDYHQKKMSLAISGGGGWCKQGAAGLWCWRGVQAAPRPSYVSQPRLDQLLLGSGRATLLQIQIPIQIKIQPTAPRQRASHPSPLQIQKQIQIRIQIQPTAPRQRASHPSPLPQPQSAYWSATHDFLQLEQQDPLQGICDIA